MWIGHVFLYIPLFFYCLIRNTPLSFLFYNYSFSFCRYGSLVSNIVLRMLRLFFIHLFVCFNLHPIVVVSYLLVNQVWQNSVTLSLYLSHLTVFLFQFHLSWVLHYLNVPPSSIFLFFNRVKTSTRISSVCVFSLFPLLIFFSVTRNSEVLNFKKHDKRSSYMKSEIKSFSQLNYLQVLE